MPFQEIQLSEFFLRNPSWDACKSQRSLQGLSTESNIFPHLAISCKLLARSELLEKNLLNQIFLARPSQESSCKKCTEWEKLAIKEMTRKNPDIFALTCNDLAKKFFGQNM